MIKFILWESQTCIYVTLHYVAGFICGTVHFKSSKIFYLTFVMQLMCCKHDMQ